MALTAVLAAAVAAALASGCEDMQVNWTNPFARTTSAPSSQPAAGFGEAESEGTSYSVLLKQFSDPEAHIQDANYYQKRLSEGLGWRGLFVVHRGGYSLLFWGQFRTVEAAQGNLRKARAYRAQDGSAPFPTAIIVPAPGKDIGPPEWNLKKVKGAYTLLVAIFRDEPERKYFGRKKFAVDYCKRLRAGGYEAYYYHGAAISHVTIGAFPESAVTVRPTDSGQEVKFNDPRIPPLQRDFPLMAINGGGVNEIVRGADGKTISVPQKTQLIRIPHEEGFYGP